MIPLIIVSALIPGAILAAVALEPHMETWATRKRLYGAHRAAGSPPEHCSGTSHAHTPETQPHTPACPTSKTFTASGKLEP